jgi:hypothetical protein
MHITDYISTTQQIIIFFYKNPVLVTSVHLETSQQKNTANSLGSILNKYKDKI